MFARHPLRFARAQGFTVFWSVLLVLASEAFIGCASAQDLVHRDITIGIIGDQTSSTNLQASYAVLQQGVAKLSQQNLDVVLHVGDLLESSRPVSEVQAQWQQATGILDALPVDWFIAAGDHDVNPPAFQQDSPDRSREQLFQQLYGTRVPAVLQHPYYSFDVDGYHFIALYSHEVLHADPRFGNIFLARVYDNQYQWLQQDLEANKNATAIVVFIHQALWYHVSGWQRVHELLRQYRVAAVISGHHHYNQDYGTTDGIRYLTVGATGAIHKNGSRNAGDVHHVSVVKLSGSEIKSVKLLPVSDNLPLSLTPRVDMDRVQALDVQLGNFFNFAQQNPVFRRSNGQLVSDCTTGTPATITVNQLGNPIDLPVNLKITFTSNPAGVTLSSPAFAAGNCQPLVSNTECVMPRTTRTFVSNYSSVDINTFSPLWTSGLAGTATAGTVLNFNFRTTFNGASGTLFLQGDVTTTVQACP
ncbi:MAG TPA: metallophosphoesterase [Thermoanaerobaculia bacterium]|jgi:3',5'-cyclic AMP phosphodiesterase CpdA